jgi:hypothetical protein
MTVPELPLVLQHATAAASPNGGCTAAQPEHHRTVHQVLHQGWLAGVQLCLVVGWPARGMMIELQAKLQNPALLWLLCWQLLWLLQRLAARCLCVAF